MPEGALRVACVGLVPDLGHVLPLVRAARAASAAGANVCVFAPDEARSAASGRGVPVVGWGAVRPDGLREALVELASAPVARRLAEVVPRYLDLCDAQRDATVARLPALLAALEDHRPDVLIVDDHPWFSRATARLAGRLGAPWLAHASEGTCRVAAAGSGLAERPGARPELARLERAAEPWIRLRRRVNARLRGSSFRAESRARRGALDRVLPGDEPPARARLAAGLAGLEQRVLGRAPPEGTVALGPLPPLPGPGLDPETVAWLESDPRPVLYTGFGTMIQPSRRFLRALVRASERLDARLLWVGGSPPPLDPHRGRAVAWLDQPAALAHPAVRAMVAHAGAGGLQEALWNALPVLAVPVAWDQHYNADLVEALGCAERVDHRRVEPDALARALERLLGDGPRARARELAALAVELAGDREIVRELASVVGS